MGMVIVTTRNQKGEVLQVREMTTDEYERWLYSEQERLEAKERQRAERAA